MEATGEPSTRGGSGGSPWARCVLPPGNMNPLTAGAELEGHPRRGQSLRLWCLGATQAVCRKTRTPSMEREEEPPPLEVTEAERVALTTFQFPRGPRLSL